MKQLDETSFDRPIPGMGMTHELGARPWQTPPTYVTVDEAADYYIEKMSSPEFKNKLLDVMAMNVPLTTVANTMQLASVMEGLHSIDTAIMISHSLFDLITAVADETGIEYKSGLTREDTGVPDDSMIARAFAEPEAEEIRETFNEEELDRLVEGINKSSSGLMSKRTEEEEIEDGV